MKVATAANTLPADFKAPLSVKFTTSFSPCGMIVRVALGMLATLFSLGFALCSSKVRNLFFSEFTTELPAIEVTALPPQATKFPSRGASTSLPLDEADKPSIELDAGALLDNEVAPLSVADQILAADELSADVEKSVMEAIEKISPKYSKDMSPKIPGVKVYESSLKGKVFSLDEFPGLIFKTGGSCQDRIRGYTASKKVCDEQEYDCVVLPKTRLHQIGGEDIIIQEKLDLLKSSDLSKYPDDREMDEAITQISHFIFKVGYSDAHQNNLPFLENEKKIGVVDFEFCGKLGSTCCIYYMCLSDSHRKIFKPIAQSYDSSYLPNSS